MTSIGPPPSKKKGATMGNFAHGEVRYGPNGAIKSVISIFGVRYDLTDARKLYGELTMLLDTMPQDAEDAPVKLPTPNILQANNGIWWRRNPENPNFFGTTTGRDGPFDCFFNDWTFDSIADEFGIKGVHLS